ncbi:MAG: alpha/beta hydrolase [Bacteroidales bacterium]|nr:alpha/beta hydrolase [Bacteroidales bacterium]
MRIKSKLILWILLWALLPACSHFDISRYREGDIFVSKHGEKTLVVVLDHIAGDTLAGRLYQNDTPIAAPHPFTLIVHGKSAKLSIASPSKEIRMTLKSIQHEIQCRYRDGKDKESMLLKPLPAPDTVTYRNQYIDPLFRTKVTKNIIYARAEGYWTSYPDEDKKFVEIYTKRLSELTSMKEQKLALDLYEPIDGSENARPLIVMIHGGAFYNGDKQDEPYKEWCQHFASIGYVAVSVNYRMGFLPHKEAIDKAGYRAVQDVNAAIRYLLHHADKYRIDPNRIFLWGTSAGAITALNVTFMQNKDRPNSVIEEGLISKHIPECKETFHVKAVANMWGAVHDTTILANSPNTSIISFHANEDPIVPYGYGIPFKDMLDLSDRLDISKHLPQFLQRDDKTSSQKKSKQMVNRFTDPLWDFIFSPMYGSACIHDYCKKHGRRSKLFTAKVAIHSLHVDSHRNIVPYFYTIQDSVARFFYTELYTHPAVLRQDKQDLTLYTLDDHSVAEVHWLVDGGVVLESSNDHAYILFFSDKKRHAVRVSGKYKDGAEFSSTRIVP